VIAGQREIKRRGKRKPTYLRIGYEREVAGLRLKGWEEGQARRRGAAIRSFTHSGI